MLKNTTKKRLTRCYNSYILRAEGITGYKMTTELQNSGDSFITAPDVAYSIIVQKILDGEFPPGMQLSRRKMAEITNVSVIPVIEALKRLEEDGLVESKPKWGSYVTIPTVEKVSDSLEAREAIECQIARILSEKMTDEQFNELYQIAEELDTVPYAENTVGPSRGAHLRFHRTLAEFSGNAMLKSMYERINLFWILCNALSVRAQHVEYPRYWHRKLMDDIRSGDPDKAEASMREHVRDSKDRILESVRNRQY